MKNIYVVLTIILLIVLIGMNAYSIHQNSINSSVNGFTACGRAKDGYQCPINDTCDPTTIQCLPIEACSSPYITCPTGYTCDTSNYSDYQCINSNTYNYTENEVNSLAGP